MKAFPKSVPTSPGLRAVTENTPSLHYAYIVSMHDDTSGLIRNYRLNFYPAIPPAVPEIEMFDAEFGKTFLRRGTYNGLHLSDMFVGSLVRVYNRNLQVVDYADQWTRDQLAVSNLTNIRKDERLRTVRDVSSKLQPYMPFGREINVRPPPPNNEGDQMLKDLLRELGSDFFADDSGKSPEEVAKEKEEKFKELKDAVMYGHVDKIPRMVRNGASMYTVTDEFSKKTLFHVAAERDKADVIRRLHSLKSSKMPDPIHFQDNTQATALHLAADRGFVGPLKALCELGADPQHKDEVQATAMHKAAQKGFEKVIRALVEFKASTEPLDRDKQTPVHLAAVAGHVGVVQALADAGADLEARDKDGATALHLASDRGQNSVIRMLQASGSDLNSSDMMGAKPLHLAAGNGQGETLRVLAELGCELNPRDMYQETPVHRAASLGKEDVIKVLLELKADLNCADKYGETALHRAAAMGQQTTIRALVAMGATKEPLDHNNRSPLHVAAGNWRRHAVLELIDAGCSLARVDNFGETPLHRAAAMGQQDAMKGLRMLGSKVEAKNEKGENGLDRLARRDREKADMFPE